MKQVRALVLVVMLVLTSIQAQTQAHTAFVYIDPQPGARFVSPTTTIALRQGALLSRSAVTSSFFHVVGAESGQHAGQAVLADDQQTVIFKPLQPFRFGEAVHVTLDTGLRSAGGDPLGGTSFSFTTSPKAVAMPTGTMSDILSVPQAALPAAARAQQPKLAQVSPYVTVPSDFPPITVSVPANHTDDGYLFLASLNFVDPAAATPYLLILDNSGQPVYYQRRTAGSWDLDFKKQGNGLLTYFDNSLGYFQAMDPSYTVVGSYAAGNGYTTDGHELQLLSNGHALVLGDDPETVDMSTIVPGGNPAATVIGIIVQELDTAKNVVFQWRSWDHFQITDTNQDLTAATIDYVHANAIEPDADGNLLVSERHMDEVTKIDRQSGAIIWRLGGKNNQFNFTNDPGEFSMQHDIRRLPNGDITLFDNRVNRTPSYSRGVEYQLDEVNKTATLVWYFRNTPDTYSYAMGRVQRLPNGNTLLGWGTALNPSVTEVLPNGTKAFEMTIGGLQASYRVFRYPWQGQPTTPPVLVVNEQAGQPALYYSWNGATDVASYQVYAGATADPTTLIDTPAKTGFENVTPLTNLPDSDCYFQVVPINTQGQAMQASPVVQRFTPTCGSYIVYFPMFGLGQ